MPFDALHHFKSMLCGFVSITSSAVSSCKSLVASPQLFTDKKQFEELCKLGAQYLRSDDIDNLKQVIRSLYGIMRKSANVEDMYDIANVLLG